MLVSAKTLNRLLSKQPMFQQGLAGTPRRKSKSTIVSGSLFAAFSRSKASKPPAIRQARPIFRMRPRFWRNPRVLRLKYRERKSKDARVRASQNRTEIPPRTERPFGPTSRIVSPFVVVVCTSSRLRASTIACARSGKPNVGRSCVT